MTPEELANYYVQRWRKDPVARIEDIFRVRRADGVLVPLKVPDPQKKIIRDGILSVKGRKRMKQGHVVRRVINKGRQIGYSIISAAEAILIAMDFPNTFQYYIATRLEQSTNWLAKLQQLVIDANHFPPELGGGPIIKADDMKPATTKIINNCKIVGLPYNPGGLRGDTAVNVVLDEMAWMILYKNQQEETYTACKHFVDQGGQLTAQSTPRASTDMFMDFYDNHDKHGFIPYYCPTIINWQKLNLNEPFIIDLDNKKRVEHGLPELTFDDAQKLKNKYSEMPNFTITETTITQNAVIPYPWKNLHELENDRRSDTEIFKQENLGVAIDERYKVIHGDWIYNNLSEGRDWEDRGDSYNQFVFGIDIAKQSDLFVITIFEKVDNIWIERRVEIMPPGQNYVLSGQRIVDLYKKFLPTAIRVDNTGGGIVFCDILEKTECKSALQRINFNQGTKANMAENVRNIARDNRLRMLNFTQEHQLIIKHLLKVERQEMETFTRYTGKDVDKEGRDDGFWSVALAVCENPHRDTIMEAGMIKAGFGKTGIRSGISQSNETRYAQIKKEITLPVLKIEENNIIGEENKLLDLAISKLKTLLLPCIKTKKPVSPIECVGCEETTCTEWNYHDKICKSLQVSKEKLKKYYETRKL